MRDYSDNNKIWTKVVKNLRSKMCDRDLQIKGPMSTKGPLANMSRFVAETRALFWREHRKITQPLKTFLA